jgi:hypothetical protein
MSAPGSRTSGRRRLHDSVKAFGKAIRDGVKDVGRTLEAYFTGKK